LITNMLLIFVAPFFFVFEVLNIMGYKAKEVREWNKIIAREINAFRKSRNANSTKTKSF
jgi:uncharacterized membrane protein YGL010W